MPSRAARCCPSQDTSFLLRGHLHVHGAPQERPLSGGSGLRERAGVRLKPPVTGAAGPMADTAIHLRDAARPLGLTVNPEPVSWVPVLEFLVSKPASRGFMPRG